MSTCILEELERREIDDRDNPNISFPNYHSGANGDYQPVDVLEPVHELLRARGRSGVQGRAVAESTFHHFADYNWDVSRGAPSFVTDRPGDEMQRDPARLAVFKDYVRNVASWLGSRSA